MPKYRFICSCDAEVSKYTSASTVSIKCTQCGSPMDRQVPSTVEQSTVKELVDSYTGVHLPPDNKEILESRRSEYFWKVEVPRLVMQYPADHCIKEGWMYVDEQGKLQVHTKPPHKR